jgi:hypothetical protein
MEDVGPCSEDDFAFVFGTSLGPAEHVRCQRGVECARHERKCGHRVAFVDESEVPDGPWTDIITVSGNNR